MILIFISLIFFFGIIAVICIQTKKNKSNKLITSDTKQNQSEYEQIPININYLPYEKNTFIFTQNEFYCYKNLKIIADKYNFEIFGKMRLADIVSVTAKGKEYMRYFGKIKSKHIDFVLLNAKTMQPKLLIELDDNSHDVKKRKERDEFVNKLCEAVKLPILHIRSYELEQLEKAITEKTIDSTKLIL